MTRSIARPTVPDMEFKAFPTGDTLALTQVIGTPHESTIVDEKGETIPVGIAEHIVAVTGVVDEVGDVIVPGAFRRTMREIKAKGVTGHDWKVRVSKALDRQEWLPGDPRIAEKIIPNLPEGKTWPAEAGALYVKAQYNLNTKEGRDAYENAKFYGNEENYSIGYKVTPGGAVKKNGVRYIKDLDWYEWSDVLHGANKWAQLLSVKSLDTLNGQIERTGFKALAAPADTTAVEVGAIELKVRYVRNTAYWGLPYGAPIPTGFSPRGALAQRLRSEGKPVREDVGVVDVQPSKKDDTLRVKPTAKGKFKRNDTLFEQQIMDEFERVQSGDADPFAQTTTDKDGDPVDGFLVDDSEQINKGGVYDPMEALIANGRTPAEVEEVLRGSDPGAFTFGRMGDEEGQQPRIDAYIADVMTAYRQKYNAALTKQNDDGKDDVAPIVDGASNAPDAPKPDAGAPATPKTPAAPAAAPGPGQATPAKPADLSPLASRMFDAIAATKPSPYLGNRLAEAADAVGGNAGITLRGTATNLTASAKRKNPAPRISPDRGAERTLKNWPDKLADNVESYAALADALDALGLGDQDDRGDGNGTISDYMRANSKAAADLLAKREGGGGEPAPGTPAVESPTASTAPVSPQRAALLESLNTAAEARTANYKPGGYGGPESGNGVRDRVRDGADVVFGNEGIGVVAVAPFGPRKHWEIATSAGLSIPLRPVTDAAGMDALPNTQDRARMFVNSMSAIGDAEGNPPPWESTDWQTIKAWRNGDGATLAEAYAGIAVPEYLHAIGMDGDAERVSQAYRDKFGGKPKPEPRRAVQAPPMPDASAAPVPAVPDAPVATGNMNAPEDMSPEQLDAEIAAARKLQADLRARKVPANSAQLADAKMRQKVFETEKRKREQGSTAPAPSTPDVPEPVVAPSTPDATTAPAATAPDAAPVPTPDTSGDRVGVLPNGKKPSPKLIALLGSAEYGSHRRQANRDAGEAPGSGPYYVDGWNVRGHENTVFPLRREGLAARNYDNRSMILNERGARLMAPYLPDGGKHSGAPAVTPDATAPDVTPDATAPTAADAGPLPDTLTLPDGRELTRDELDQQESEFLTDRWTLRDDAGRVAATVERDVDGDFTWTVTAGDQSRSGYGARTPQDATDRLAQQLDAAPGDGQPDAEPTFAPNPPDGTTPPEEFAPAADATIPAADIAQARDLSGGAEGLVEADDGELEVSPDVAERQDRVEALLTQAPDLSGMDDATIGETRRDVVDELRLQEEIARRDRERGTTPTPTPTPTAAPDTGAAPATVGADTVPATEGDGAPPAVVEPAGPKPRPGVAGAAEDLADALDDGNTARTATVRTRLDSSLRRSRSDSPIVGELRTLLAADGEPDAGAIRDAADRLRAEARDKRNAGARSRRLAKRLERERLRSLLGEIDAEMRTRNLDPDRFGGPAPTGDRAGAPATDTTPDAVPGGTPAAPDDVITPDELAQAQDLAVQEDTARDQAAPPDAAPSAPAGRTPATYGELQDGDTFVSPMSGATITVDNVQAQDGGRVAVSGSDGNNGREFNLFNTADPIPGATPEAGPQGPATPATGTPGAPPAPAPAPAAVTPDPPDSPAARMMTARIGDRLTARTGGSTAAEIVFETTGEPVKQRDGGGATVTSVDARSNTLGEGSLRSFVDWTGAPRLTFTPDTDGREITLSPTSLDNGNPFDAAAVPEGTYRASDTGQQTVLGQHYVGGYKQISPRRWAWSAELYPADGTGGAVVSKNGKVANAEEAQRAIRDAVETGYLTRSDYGSRVPEGETLPTVPERSVAPVARSVVAPVQVDFTDPYSGPVNPITGRPDYTEAPEMLAKAVPTRFAGAGPDEISAHFAERVAAGKRGTDPADVQWDTAIIAPGGGLMAYKPVGPAYGSSGYTIVSTVSGAPLLFGSVNVDKPTAVAIMDTLTRGVPPGGGQIDWDKDNVGTRGEVSAIDAVEAHSPMGRELDRAFPDEGGIRGLAKFGMSRVIATKLERNQANSPVVRNAIGVFYAGKVDPTEYPNHESADKRITMVVGALRDLLHDGKRNRASWATDDRTDEQIKDDAETIRYAQGANAVFDLGAPDKAIAMIERRIDELEQLYGHSGTDVTKGGAAARGSVMLRRVVESMRAAFDPQAKGPQALKAMQRGDRFIVKSPGSSTGRRVFRVQHNVEAPGNGARMLHVLEEGATHVGANREQRIEVTDRGISFAEGSAMHRPVSADAVRLDTDEIAPEGTEAVADRIAQTTPMPALDEAITRAREVLDNRIGPITREKPKAASRKADRAKQGDADRSGVINRPGAGSASSIDPEVAARILERQDVLMRARLGQDIAFVEKAPPSPAFTKVSQVKGTWDGNELSDDVEFWRTARLSAGGWFVTAKDGTIWHAESGRLMARGTLADQSTADRFASYLERAVDPETGAAYDWKVPQSTVKGMHRTTTARIAADPEKPTRAEQMQISDQMPVRALKDMAELDELVAKGPGATKKLIAPVAGQHDKGDLPEGFHVPHPDQDVYVQATGTTPGQRGDYPSKASVDNAKKLTAAYDWARTVGAVRPFDAIAGLRGLAEKNRGERIVRMQRGPTPPAFEQRKVEQITSDLGDTLDKLADSLERDADPNQWSEMDKLNRAGGRGDLTVTDPKVEAQELASGRGAAENEAYAKAIADAIKANGVRLEYNPNNSYRGNTRIPPHWKLRVPGARGFGEEYSDPATGDLVIEQIDQYGKGVTVTPDGTVHAQWRTPAPDGPDYAETIMHITFTDGDWKFVEQAVDADGNPIEK